MPNYIKYSTNTQTLALKSGNYYIGTGDVRKGPTSTTDYWSCVIPPTSGYTVYLNKASNGPSIYTCNNDTDLINITNRIASQSYTSATQCLVYYLGQNDKLCANIDYPTIVTNGLVLNLDAGFVPSYPRTATTWYDLSVNGNNGTLINGPTYSTDGGGSIVFDGTNDYIITTLNQTPSLDITSTITLETWLKSTVLANASHGDGIMSKGLSSDNNSGVYETLLTVNGSVNQPFFRIRIGSNTPTYAPSNIPIIINQIYHFVSTYDGSIMRIFINGIESGTGNVTSGNIQSNTEPLTIGVRYTQRGGGGGDSFFSGNIYATRIYNRALSAAEVLQNYNATKARYIPNIVTNGLVLYLDAGNTASYPGSGTVWTDISGNGNNGTLINGPTFSSTNGGVIVLDGVNDYIDIPINLTNQNYTVMGAARYVTIGGRTFSAKNNNWLMGHWSTTTRNYYAEGWVSSVTSAPGNGESDTNWRIYSATGNYSEDSWALYVNGQLNVGPNNGGTNGPNQFSIGRYAPGNSEYSNSQIGNLIVYNRILTASEILQNFNALRSRFGI